MLAHRLLCCRRPCLVTSSRILQAVPRPRYSSTQGQNRTITSSAITATACFAAGATAGWVAFRNGSRDELASAAAKSVSTYASNQVPDLNRLGTSDEITYAPPPTSEEVTKQLNEKAFSLAGPKGIIRYDGTQVASNSPCEDAFMHGSFSSPFGGEDWMAWAVFDGHCGWQTSNMLTRQLMPFVRRALGELRSQNAGSSSGDVPEEAIHSALKKAFTTLDDSLVKSAADTIKSSSISFPEKARRLELAYAGACALLALYDPATRTLRVASTGDCRAVLGQRAADGRWEATELTTDQTGANPAEIARLQAQFPDEPEVVKGGRVWGMQPSRTFGDGMWKWAARLKQELRHHYNGLSLPSGTRYKDYKEGPYLTAEPAVRTVSLDPARPTFLILATDGLWDTMSSAQAVDLVGRWVDWQMPEGGKGKAQTPPPPPNPNPADFGPTFLGWKQQCKYEERKATLQDDNAAVHLVRNGLGGAHDEMVRGALTFRYPNARDIRDDMTVQVVFFSPER
ncbi:phosphatase 2C-like domain-containing protein [Biscogniauxia mediterranea]|nr:phosphatase 2C-like domain-containing protein [Biscogniauxia mediterranea]